MPGQIEVGVIGEIADGILIAHRIILQGQRPSLQMIHHSDGKGTGIALVPIGTDQGQRNPVFPAILNGPKLFVKAA